MSVRLWTDAEAEYALTEARKGCSATEIRKGLLAQFELVVSRSAVIGKLTRLRQRGNKLPKHQPQKPKLASRIGPVKTLSARKPRAVAIPSGLEPMIKPCPPEDRPGDGCQWPYGERPPFAWCGRIAKGVYCDAHASEAKGEGTASERAVTGKIAAGQVRRGGDW